ncbi:hypothetical protein P9112_012788 [Eukaryota sp. TZLM1-RC]
MYLSRTSPPGLRFTSRIKRLVRCCTTYLDKHQHALFIPILYAVIIYRVIVSSLCFKFMFGSGAGPKKHLNTFVLLLPFLKSLTVTLSLYVCFFAILSLTTAFLRSQTKRSKSPKSTLLIFYLVLYSISLFILCIPIADLIFNLTSGEKLTPSTIKAYITSSTGGNPFSIIIDSLTVSKTLVPKVYKRMLNLIIKSFISILIISFLIVFLRFKMPNLTKRINKVSVRSFLAISVLCFLILLTPMTREQISSFDPVVKSTKSIDLFFFFKPPIYPKNQVDKDLNLLRTLFPLPENEYWISNDYPLVHGNLEKYCQFNSKDQKCIGEEFNQTPNQAQSETYDIFVVMWESLSGNIISLNKNKFISTTPHLDKLIKDHGVFYQNLVSNGCPTSNAFWSFINMGWPLSHGNTIIDTLGKEFDSIYHVIKRSPANYFTSFLSASSPRYSRLIDWLRRANVDDVYFKYKNHGSDAEQVIPMGERFARIWNNDRILVEQFKEKMKSFDKQLRGKSPIFSWLMSISSHAPYTTFDTVRNVGSEVPDDKAERYIRAIRYADEHLIKNLVDYLKSRKRAKNTILVVLGDHAAYKSGLNTHCEGCPQQPFDGDQTFFTSGAIAFFGNDKERESLGLPPPGTIDTRPVSALDITDTIIKLSGSQTATHTLGRSLLNPQNDTLSRHSLSLISMGGELNSANRIVRSDWSGVGVVTLKQSRPSYIFENVLDEQNDMGQYIIRLNNFYNHLVSTDAIWHTDFALDPKEHPQLDLPPPKPSFEPTPPIFSLFLVILVLISVVDLIVFVWCRAGKRVNFVLDKLVEIEGYELDWVV